MPNVTITVNLNATCPECGKRGTTGNGLCLHCTTRSMVPERTMKSDVGRAVQARWARIRAERLPADLAAQMAGEA